MKLLLATLISLYAAPERTLLDRVVAVVDDDVITLSDLNEAAKPFLQQNNTPERRARLMEETLDQLISEKLLAQQIRLAKIDVSDSEVERAIEDISRQNNISRDQLQQAVEARGMSMSQYKDDLGKQLTRLKLIDLKVRSKVVVPESDVKAEYERQAKLEGEEELVTISHLFFRFGENADKAEKTRIIEQAKAGRARVEGGESFAKVAKEISQGPTASTGGSLGEMNTKSLLPELVRAVERLKPKELSPPIITDNGVHVVYLESRRNKAKESFDAVRDQIYQKLYQKEVERQMKIWVGELRSKAAVDIRL